MNRPSATTSQSHAPRQIKITKPAGKAAAVFNLDGDSQIDLSAIAAEKITLVRSGDKLVILFNDQGSVTLGHFFDDHGRPAHGTTLQLGPDRVLDGERFASSFPIVDDQSVLPGAGEGTSRSGFSFNAFHIDQLSVRSGLELLGNWLDARGNDGTRNGPSLAHPTVNGRPTASDLTLGLDDDDLHGGNRGGLGDDPGASTLTGKLPASFGPDGAGTVAFNVTSGPIAGLTSDGEQVRLAVSADGHVITASTAHGTVFTVSLTINRDASISYSVKLFRPLDHMGHDNPATQTIESAFEDNILLHFPVTIQDRNGDRVTTTLHLNFDDDTPTLGTATAGRVDEDGGLPGSNWFGPQDAFLTPRVTVGSLAIDWGADDGNSGLANRAVAFNAIANGQAATHAGGALTAGGEAVHLWVVGTTLYGYVGAAPANGATPPATAQRVFTVTLSDALSGVYSFTLHANLDHPVANTEDDLRLTFGFRATDADGDAITGSFRVTVDDDTPVIGHPQDRTVDEDGLAGGLAGGAGDVAGEITLQNGDLAIRWGADSDNVNPNGGVSVAGHVDGDRAVTFAPGIAPPAGLTSSGIAVAYEISNDGTLLTAYRNSAGSYYDGEGHVATAKDDARVFTVSLSDSGSGSYSFQLVGALDHQPGGDENDVDLTFKFVATDSDGDRATDCFTVKIDDDTPTAADVSLAAHSEAALTDALVITGNVTAAVAPGADGFRGGSFATAVTFTDAPTDLSVIDVTSRETHAVTFDLANPVRSGAEITLRGYADVNGARDGMAPVIELVLNADGSVAYRQFQPLRHGEGGADDDARTLSFGYTVSDRDGDATAPQAISVTIQDEGPTVSSPVTRTVKEGPGDQSLSGVPLGVVFGVDGASASAAIAFNSLVVGAKDQDGIGLALRSSGAEVKLGYLDADHTILVGFTGSLPSTPEAANIVFTARLHDTGTGLYDFTLRQPLDHLAPDERDQFIDLTFGYTATDGDGDTADGSFTVRVDAAGGVGALRYSALTTGVFVNLSDTSETRSGETVAAHTATDRAAATDKVIGIDQVGATLVAFGSQSHDILVGGAEDNIFFGEGGNDVLVGGKGRDLLFGGAGANTLVASADIDDVGPQLFDFDLGNGTVRSLSLAGHSVTLDGFTGNHNDIDVLRFEAAAGASGFFFDGNHLTAALEGIDDFYGTDGDDIVTLPAFYPADLFLNTLNGGAGNDALAGSDLGERIYGGSGNDLLSGLGGSDSLYGEQGNDELYGGAGADTLDGGDGNDLLWGGRGADQLKGGGGNDTLYATADIDDVGSVAPLQVDLGDGATRFVSLNGLSTDQDVLLGHGGFDTVQLVKGATASGVYFNPWGANSLNGIEYFIGSEGGDVIALNRAYTTDGGQVNISAGAGDDVISATDLAAGDWIVGGSGNDLISGLGGDDDLYGEDGDDEIHGGAGDDTIQGDNGNDLLFGGSGNDTVKGGGGDDRIVWRSDQGSDTAPGGDGSDTFEVTQDPASGGAHVQFTLYTHPLVRYVYLNWADASNNPQARIVTSEIETFDLTFQNGGADELEVLLDAAAPRIVAHFAGGNDIWRAGASLVTDELDGGAGIDRAVYTAVSNQSGGVQINLGTEIYAAPGGALAGETARFVLAGQIATDRIVGFEDVDGGAGADLLVGSSGVNFLWAQDDDDTLVGGRGDDNLHGEYGNDTFIWSIGDGSDLVDGGAESGGADRQIVRLDDRDQSIVITAYDPDGDPTNGAQDWAFVAIDENRDGAFDASLAMFEIEEYALDLGGGADQVVIGFPNFAGTNLETIRVDAGSGDDLIDLTALTLSDLRVVADGGNGVDTVKLGFAYPGTAHVEAITDPDDPTTTIGARIIFDTPAGPVTHEFTGFEQFDFTDGTRTLAQILGPSVPVDVQPGYDGGVALSVGVDIVPAIANSGGALRITEVDPDGAGPMAAVAVAATGFTTIELGDGSVLTVSAQGTFTYDPALKFQTLSSSENGTDTIAYTVVDSAGQAKTYSATYTVPGGFGPVFSAGNDVHDLQAWMNVPLVGWNVSDHGDALAGDDTIVLPDGSYDPLGIYATQYYHQTFNGGQGEDHIYVRSSDVDIDGGQGSDTADFSLFSNPGGVHVSLGSQVALLGAEGVDGPWSDGRSYDIKVVGFEKLRGSSFADDLVGDDGDNVLEGGGGSDFIKGGGGTDRLLGGDGDDTLQGDGAQDYLTGGAGVDTLIGGAGDDVFYAEGTLDVDDVFLGGDGSDTLWLKLNQTVTLSGFDSSDPFGSASGSGIEDLFLEGSVIVGTDLANTFDFSRSDIVSSNQLGTWVLDTGAGNDEVRAASNLPGLGYRGGAGDDTIIGGSTLDFLAGDAGNDVLTGGGDTDYFVFAEAGATNRDVITDYDALEGDLLDLSALLDANFNGGSADGFVRAVHGDGNDALAQVDVDGGGDNWQDVAVLQGYYDQGADILVRLEQSGALQAIHGM